MRAKRLNQVKLTIPFKIAKTKRDAMLIDFGPNEDFAIAIIDSDLFSVCRKQTVSLRANRRGIQRYRKLTVVLHFKLRHYLKLGRLGLEARFEIESFIAIFF